MWHSGDVKETYLNGFFIRKIHCGLLADAHLSMINMTGKGVITACKLPITFSIHLLVLSLCRGLAMVSFDRLDYQHPVSIRLLSVIIRFRHGSSSQSANVPVLLVSSLYYMASECTPL